MQQYVRGGYGAESQDARDRYTQGPVGEQTASDANPQTTSGRFCRKCFLRDMELRGGLAESYKAMLERLEMMDPELRCTGDTYEARLAQCKKCEYLMEGMCALCGCFAESRAAVKANSCPAERKRWEEEL